MRPQNYIIIPQTKNKTKTKTRIYTKDNTYIKSRINTRIWTRIDTNTNTMIQVYLMCITTNIVTKVSTKLGVNMKMRNLSFKSKEPKKVIPLLKVGSIFLRLAWMQLISFTWSWGTVVLVVKTVASSPTFFLSIVIMNLVTAVAAAILKIVVNF